MNRIRKALVLLSANPALLISVVLGHFKTLLFKTANVCIQKKNNALAFEFDFSYGVYEKKYYFGIYEPLGLEAIRRILKKGDTFIDVGANAGYMTVVAAAAVGTEGQVHSFEPVPRDFGRLVKVQELNPGYQIHCNQVACGDSAGQSDIYVSNICGWSTMVPALMGGGTCIETIKSPVIRLDDYLREREGAIGRVTLIKIDTEGFEFPVLKGLQGFFESGEVLPAILCEVSYDASRVLGFKLEQIAEYLGRYGYEAYSLLDYRTKIDLSALSELTDVLFLPTGRRITFLLPELKLGGAEKHVIRLAGELRKLKYDARITCVFREGVLASEARAQSIPLECLNAPYRWDLGTMVRIYRWLRRERLDILHTYLFGFHLFAGFPAWLSGVRIILSTRREMADWQKRRHLWIERIGNLFADAVVCCSEAVRKRTLDKEKVPSALAATIHNGVDMERFKMPGSCRAMRKELGIPDSAKVVGTVANVAWEKGYSYLLEAASSILQKNQDVWFLFVGKGPLYDVITRRAAEIPGAERVLFTGFRTDIPELLSAMDIFVLSSVSEGFPNVLLEAMAASKPVVATRVGGIPELIEHERDGLLVNPESGDELAQAITELLNNPEKAAFLSRNACDKISRQFTLRAMTENYEKLYKRLFI